MVCVLTVTLGLLGLLGWSGPTAWWTWPVGSAQEPPAVIRAFDPPDQPWLRGHRGVDLAAAPGGTVRAAADAVVVHAGPLAGRGVVSLRHVGGLTSTYEPVRAEVAVGAVVRAGQVIGTVEGSGNHASCAGRTCLHWGARWGERYLDPLDLVAPGWVRLLAPRQVQSATARSGPWMGLTVGLPQALDGDVGVALGRRHRGVTEDLLNRPQVRPALE